MVQNKIKILELIDEAKIGGGQIHVLLLTKYLNKKQFDLHVACEEKGYLVDELVKIGIPIIQISISNKLKYSSLANLVNIFKENNFDIIHTHGGTAGFWGRLATLFLKNKPIVVHTFHGLHYLNLNFLKRISFLTIDRLLSRITDMNIYVCKSDLEKGIKHKLSNDKNSIIINNGIDIEEFAELDERENERARFAFQRYFVFGNVGRLHKQKGQEYLLRAFAFLVKKYQDVYLAIVGDGELRDNLLKLTEELGISDKVIFLGNRKDISRFLHAIDVFVLSSLWEGQPLTIFEAMAAAKPIIATAVDGVTEVLKDQNNAILCRPGDAESLFLAMEKLYKDKNLAKNIAIEARNNVINKYSAESTAKNISDLYISLYKKFKNMT